MRLLKGTARGKPGFSNDHAFPAGSRAVPGPARAPRATEGQVPSTKESHCQQAGDSRRLALCSVLLPLRGVRHGQPHVCGEAPADSVSQTRRRTWIPGDLDAVGRAGPPGSVPLVQGWPAERRVRMQHRAAGGGRRHSACGQQRSFHVGSTVHWGSRRWTRPCSRNAECPSASGVLCGWELQPRGTGEVLVLAEGAGGEGTEHPASCLLRGCVRARGRRVGWVAMGRLGEEQTVREEGWLTAVPQALGGDRT